MWSLTKGGLLYTTGSQVGGGGGGAGPPRPPPSKMWEGLNYTRRDGERKAWGHWGKELTPFLLVVHAIPSGLVFLFFAYLNLD